VTTSANRVSTHRGRRVPSSHPALISLSAFHCPPESRIEIVTAKKDARFLPFPDAATFDHYCPTYFRVEPGLRRNIGFMHYSDLPARFLCFFSSDRRNR
jgi:hypothetical protein